MLNWLTLSTLLHRHTHWATILLSLASFLCLSASSVSFEVFYLFIYPPPNHHHLSAQRSKQLHSALRCFTIGHRSKRWHLGVNYGSTRLAFMAVILIFTKATCHSVVDAGRCVNCLGVGVGRQQTPAGGSLDTLDPCERCRKGVIHRN